MLLLSLLACLDAAADPPVQWEYATIDVFLGTDSVTVSTDPPGAIVGLVPAQAKGATTFPGTVAVLDAAGLQGWEVAAAMPDGVYLAKRRR